MAATDRTLQSDPSAAGTARLSRSALIGLLVLAFVAGVIATGWLLTRTGWGADAAAADVVAAEPAPAPDPATPALARLADSVDPVSGALTRPGGADAAQLKAAPPAGSLGPLGEQVGTLEARLATIRTAADQAEGDARRAEAMLLAFAARRTLDRGVPLGFLQAQLRARFPSQPRAVDTIVDAAARPVTVESLRAALPDLAVRRTGLGVLSFLRREGQPLIAFRQSDQPSSSPAERLDRAEEALGRGDVAAALAEVETLSPTPERDAWVRSARRYQAVRQALDVVETAAILQGSGAIVPADEKIRLE